MVAVNVVMRDDETGFAAVIRATRVRKFDYLFGRFTGSFLTAMAIFAAVPPAILPGMMMPRIERMKLGPFRPRGYLCEAAGGS